LAGLACRLGRNSVVRYFGNIWTFAPKKLRIVSPKKYVF